MANAALPTRPRSRSRSEHRPSTAPPPSLYSMPVKAATVRPPRSLSRPSNIHIDMEAVMQPIPRKRGSGGLALQARDSLSVRKRTMSTGAMSARAARHNAKRTQTDLLQPTTKRPERSPSSPRHRKRSHSPTRAPAVPHVSRSPSPSSSSPSQSPTPITPGRPPLSGGPSSYRERGRTHVPHDSQGTSTSAYPASSSISSRSLSHSPDRSRTPSPALSVQKPSLHISPITTSLDLDPNDVNARLRLLVNNNYFLPPAHAKPELSPSRPSTGDKGATSPSTFKEFFRVGKKKERKVSEPNGYSSEGGRHVPHGRLLRISSDGAPQPSSSGPDGRFAGSRHGDGYFDISSPEERTRNRVVVVRETLESLPPPLPRTPLRAHAYNATNMAYNDPTIHYDVPPPTHFPSFVNLQLDPAGITGNVQLDQFVPPGEPWSPEPSSPSGSGMDPQERVWRRAILEQAVDLSLSSVGEAGLAEMSFARGGRKNNEEYTGATSSVPGTVTPTSPKSPKNKRSWWGRRDKDGEDAKRRPSTSSSLTSRDVQRSSGSHRGAHSLDADAQSQTSEHHTNRDLIGQRIIPNMHAELEEFEREQALRQREQGMGLPPSLRLKPSCATSLSAPVTPLYQSGQDPPDTGTSTVLRPPPSYRRGERRRNISGEDVAREFMPGHSTIRKSLSSPLLSDLHERDVIVERHVSLPLSESNDSLNGVAAPSLVLQDPSGVTSLVNSNTMDSCSSGSHYDDDEHEFDGVMTPAEHFHEDDAASLEQWHTASSSPFNRSGRPSLDSFGAERVRSPEYHPRASSTFGFRRSNISVTTPSPLRESARGIEVDISGDPMEHLSMLERSPTPSGESHISSARGYVSALDYTTRSEAPSVGRPASPPAPSMHSIGARVASFTSAPEHESGVESEAPAPIEFFDSIQHESFIDGDDRSSDSEDDMTPPQPDMKFAAFPERPPDPQPLSRKSLSSSRPTPVFTTQFRNVSQPQLPVTRVEPIDTSFRHMMSYDILDRKKPLTNMPVSAPATMPGGILSQFKAKSNKSPVKVTSPFLSIGKKRSGNLPVVLPQSTFELPRHPSETAFSLESGAGTTTTGSEPDGGAASSHVFDGARSQGSLLSLQGSDTVSLRHAGSWQSAQDNSVRKLDGMMMQHLEAERDRLRKIASAAKERGGGVRARH